MAKLIKTGKDTVLMEISKVELNVYVNSFLNQINEEEIEKRDDQALMLMGLVGLEPLIPHCTSEIKTYFDETLEDIKSIEWEDDNQNETNETPNQDEQSLPVNDDENETGDFVE